MAVASELARACPLVGRVENGKMDELGGPCPRVLSLLGENSLLDHAPSRGELVFDRPVPIEIDGEPMRADGVKTRRSAAHFCCGFPTDKVLLGVRWLPHAFDSFIGDGTGLG